MNSMKSIAIISHSKKILPVLIARENQMSKCFNIKESAR